MRRERAAPLPRPAPSPAQHKFRFWLLFSLAVRKVSGNTLSDHTPQVLNDGRVLFTRWDYGIDKNVFCRQNLWTMNPDGTGFRLFGSNTKEDPDGFWHARAIPGRPEVVCVFGPHHSNHGGMIGLVWNRMAGRARDRRGEESRTGAPRWLPGSRATQRGGGRRAREPRKG